MKKDKADHQFKIMLLDIIPLTYTIQVPDIQALSGIFTSQFRMLWVGLIFHYFHNNFSR